MTAAATREDTIYRDLSKLFDGPRVVKAPADEGMGQWDGDRTWRVAN